MLHLRAYKVKRLKKIKIPQTRDFYITCELRIIYQRSFQPFQRP